MKLKKWLIGVLVLAVVLIAGGLWMLRGKSVPVEAGPGTDERSLVEVITTAPAQTAKKGKSSPLTRLLTTGADKTRQAARGGNDADDGDDDEEDTPEEKAVKHWEQVIAVFYEETEDDSDNNGNVNTTTTTASTTTQPKEPRVTLEDQLRVRDAFREMTEENRMEEVHHAMNLLPDESIAVIYGVLFDKTQPEDIMDVIFSDILNRDEAIKILMMREIAKDPTHPMYEESVRILEITDDN